MLNSAAFANQARMGWVGLPAWRVEGEWAPLFLSISSMPSHLQSSIYFYRHLLSTYYVPGGDTTVRLSLFLRELLAPWAGSIVIRCYNGGLSLSSLVFSASSSDLLAAKHRKREGLCRGPWTGLALLRAYLTPSVS